MICMHGPYESDYAPAGTYLHEFIHMAQWSNAPNGFPNDSLSDGMANYLGRTTKIIYYGNPELSGHQFPFNNLTGGWEGLWYTGENYYSFLFNFKPSNNFNYISHPIYETNVGWNRSVSPTNYKITYAYGNTSYSHTPLPGFENTKALTDRLEANQCANNTLWPNHDTGQTKEKCIAASFSDIIQTNTYNGWDWSYYYSGGFKRSWLTYADFNWWGDVSEGVPAYNRAWNGGAFVDVTAQKQKIITKYHPFGRTRPDNPPGTWFSEGFQNYQTGYVTVIVKAKCDSNTGGNSDILTVFVDGVQIGQINGLITQGVIKSHFFPVNLTNINWHSLEFRGTHTPTIYQAVVGVGYISDMQVNAWHPPAEYDCGRANNSCDIINTSLNLSAGDYVVELDGKVNHTKYNNAIRDPDPCWWQSLAWVEVAGDSGWPLNTQGVTSLAGDYDNTPTGSVSSSMITAYETYNRASIRRIVNIPAAGNKNFVVKGKQKVKIYEALIYPKPSVELFNMYFATLSPYEIFYLHPVSRNVIWDNWINLQGVDYPAPGEVYAEYTTYNSNSTGFDKYSNPSQSFGNYLNPLVLRNTDYSNNNNYVFVVSAPEYRKNYKIIFN